MSTITSTKIVSPSPGLRFSYLCISMLEEYDIITRPFFQEETGFKMAWVFPSSGRIPLCSLKRMPVLAEISRDRIPANSLAWRQNLLHMLSRSFFVSRYPFIDHQFIIKVHMGYSALLHSVHFPRRSIIL